jgi:hypothetical protein
MAHEEGGSPGIFDSIESGIKEYWPWLTVAGVVYFLWKNNLLYGLFAQIIFPLIGVIILGRIAWKLWIHYIQQDFISGIEFVLLEIIPPRDVLRSPKAMELFISNALYHQSGKGGREEYWQGAVHFWFSLELVSIDGQVHFYIRVPSRIQSLIETQMYAQYPQAQVKVVEDYSLAVDEISPSSQWMAWGCEFKLRKPSAYPIKTYIDFGLDKDPKEEVKVDPISPVIEFFGSLQKGEQAWMQILITPSHSSSTFKKYDWVAEAQKEMIHMLAPYSSHKDVKEVHELGVGRSRIEIRVPPFYDRAMKSMNAKTSKLGFDTGIRVMYVAKKDVYAVNRRKDIRLIFRQYAAPDVNEFVRYNSTQGDALGSEIFGLSQTQVMKLANRMLMEYQERGGFFYHPIRHQLFNDHKFPFVIKFFVKKFFLPYFHSETFVLNTEELATIWHFPGQILKVPSLTRIESKEAAPPPNLPI